MSSNNKENAEHKITKQRLKKGEGTEKETCILI